MGVTEAIAFGPEQKYFLNEFWKSAHSQNSKKFNFHVSRHERMQDFFEEEDRFFKTF